MSLRTSPQTGVAPSRDSLRSQSASPKPSPTGKVARASPASARRMRACPEGAERFLFALSVGFAASSPFGGAKGRRIVTGGNPWKGPHHCEHWFAMTTSITVPARMLTNLSNFVFNSVIGCSKPPSILKARKVAEAVSRLLSNSVESSFLPLFFPNPKRKPPMVRPSGVFPLLLPNCVVPP